MKRPAMHQILFVIVACLTLLLGVAISGAQDENLLTNPGFEEGFRTVPGQPDRRVADGWNPWHIPATAGMPAYQNAQPEYDEVAPNTARIRSGDNAQMYFNTFFTHTGGVYQRVTGITPGTELRFSVYVYVWSSTLEDEDISESPGMCWLMSVSIQRVAPMAPAGISSGQLRLSSMMPTGSTA
jgi:hypothetical protein